MSQFLKGSKENWVIKHLIVVYSGFNTDYGSSEPLKTLVMLCYVKSSTTQRRNRLQHGYCIGVSSRSAQATAGKGLAQGPYVTARAGVEPTTLRLKVIVSTKAPPRHTCRSYMYM